MSLHNSGSVSYQAGVALGSNLGKREEILRWAIQELQKIHIGAASSFLVSSFFETLPVDCPEDSSSFLNAILQLETSLEPLPLLKLLQQLEVTSGRPAIRAKNIPRTLDLDLLYHGSSSLKTSELELPHPGIRNRLFVLEPLTEILPNLRLQHWDKTAQEYLLFLKEK